MFTKMSLHRVTRGVWPISGLHEPLFHLQQKHLRRLTLSLLRVQLIDFTLSNARQFYSSMGNPTGVKGLIIIDAIGLTCLSPLQTFPLYLFSKIVTVLYLEPFD